MLIWLGGSVGSGVVTGGEVVVTAVLVVVVTGIDEEGVTEEDAGVDEGVEVATTICVGYTDADTVSRIELSKVELNTNVLLSVIT